MASVLADKLNHDGFKKVTFYATPFEGNFEKKKVISCFGFERNMFDGKGQTIASGSTVYFGYASSFKYSRRYYLASFISPVMLITYSL